MACPRNFSERALLESETAYKLLAYDTFIFIFAMVQFALNVCFKVN